MNLKSGELYFINERDVLTGDAFDYYKIGLVKDVRQGDAGTRLDEHQTGNPRRLVIVDRVDAPAISDLEKSVHNRFARQRVLGEWFVLEPAQLADAIATAKALATEQSENAPAFERARELTGNESDGTTRAADTEDLHWYVRAREAKNKAARIAVLRSRSEDAFKGAIERGTDVGLYAGYTSKVRKVFDQAILANLNAELLEQFLGTETKMSQRFALQGVKGAPDVRVPDEVFLDFEDRFTAVLDALDVGAGSFESVHQMHLELLGFQAQAKWDADIAESNLKTLMGVHAGIDGVATWSRVLRERPKFDESGFKREYPELHAACVVEMPVQAFAVTPMRSYRPDTSTSD